MKPHAVNHWNHLMQTLEQLQPGQEELIIIQGRAYVVQLAEVSDVERIERAHRGVPACMD